MKTALITLILVFGALLGFTAEPKAMTDVDTESMMGDTTLIFTNAGENDFALAFWLPQEFWMSIFSQDPSISAEDSSEIIGLIEGLSILAVVQADISAFGSFDYFPENEIRSGMTVTFTNTNSETINLITMIDIHPDLEMILMIFQQIFGAAMGSFGENLQYFIIEDNNKSGDRIANPYLNGSIRLGLTKRNDAKMTSTLVLPLNSLYVPRKCPNGEDAHISWIYCPWTGVKLED